MFTQIMLFGREFEKSMLLTGKAFLALASFSLNLQSMIRKLKSGEYRIYSIKKDPKTNKRRNLGTFGSMAAAKKHEQAIQYFKNH